MPTADSRPVPRATYRLQLSRDFTFADVERIAPYLSSLGVSHVYLSPILKARSGSTHGYDTVDHTQVNPELGGIDGFRRMATTLQEHGLRIVLDIVPNHMGIGGAENALWLDVLEWGRASRYADWFDINWETTSGAIKNKVLVPFLGMPFEEALASDAFELRFDRQAGEFAVWMTGHKLPISPTTYPLILNNAVPGLPRIGGRFSHLRDDDGGAALKRELSDAFGDPADAEAIKSMLATYSSSDRAPLRRLIEAQHWRPARFTAAADAINYRRFFINSDLAGIRAERDDVFEHTHRLIFDLVAEGAVDGLRVDHIDGLYDPKAYCLKLRAACPRAIYLLVEKILADDEALRPDWEADGTTGYEFGALLSRLLVDPAASAALTASYAEYTGLSENFAEIERSAKLAILDFEMAAELDALTDRICVLGASGPATRDIPRNGVRNALRLMLSSFEVYRTYVDPDGASGEDRRRIDQAAANSRRMVPLLDASIGLVATILAGENAGRDRDAVRDIAQRAQQLSGPVMAKGLEDTALYRFNRLISGNDVGCRPDPITVGVDDFHAANIERAAQLPAAMLGTSSHDSKRGEDTRARIAAISLHPERWQGLVAEWRDSLKAAGAPEISSNDSYYFFQMLLGAWPAAMGGAAGLADAQLAVFADRLEQAMIKSVREARIWSNWTAPQAEYEDRVGQFIAVALRADSDNRFLASFRRFEDEIGRDGAWNGILQLALKLTVPGVPDIYQGAELWEQSMVDPDNRRPVDFELRVALLRTVQDAPSQALADWRSGALKLWTTTKLLGLRRRWPDLFRRGTYRPIRVRAPNPVLAFERRHAGEAIVVVAALRRPELSFEVQIDTLNAADRWIDVLKNAEVPALRIGFGPDTLPAAVLIRRPASDQP